MHLVGLNQIKNILKKKIVKIVVQINGKKRGIIDCKKDIMQKDVIKIIEKNNEFEKYFKGKEIIKNIYIQNKIINFLIK